MRDRRSLRRALDPGDPFGTAHLRVVQSARRVRAIVGLGGAAVVLFAPGVSLPDRIVVASLFVSYVAVAWIVDAVALRMLRSSRLLNLLVAMVAGFVSAVLVPEMLPAVLLGFLAAVVINTSIGGLRGGVEAGVSAVVLAGTAQWLVPAPDRVSPFTLVMFVFFLVAIVTVVDATTRERRHAADDLERMQHALRSVTPAPGLVPTLDSVVHSVVEVVDAAFAAIVLREGEVLVPAAASRGDDRHLTTADLAPDQSGPVGEAIVSGLPVVTNPDDALVRYPSWCDRWSGRMAETGIASVACVPLRAGDPAIGVLVACFGSRVRVGDSVLDLLQAYADQAALVIVRAQAYDQAMRAAAELEAADRVKSEFLAAVSHDLRTPLTATKGFVDTVLAHWDRLADDERRRLLVRASANADDLARQIEQLLDLSRIEAGRVEPIAHDLELAPLVEETLARHASLLADRQLRCVLPAGLQARVDPDAFEHVLGNLLANAVQFSDRGSVVEIGARAGGRTVTVWVRDEGIGIHPDDIERIFERFEQAGPEERRRRGTGIGLAIVRSFVELQGGTVWVESRPGEGSTFRFTVPAAGSVVVEASA